MKILGIDPGYAIVGFGIVEYKGNKFTPIEYGAITTDNEMPFPERLKYIYDRTTDIINMLSPFFELSKS